jgi:hypothetical protein
VHDSSRPFRSVIGLVLFVSSSARGIPQDSSKPLDVPEKVMAARLLNDVAPKLPEGSLKRCSNALVMLKVTIDDSGKIIEQEVTSGYEALKSPSLEALKQWTYKPYERDGHTVSVRTQISVFYLGDGESFPMYSPDGRGGVKGGNMIPLPPGCGPGPTIVRPPERPSQ